MILLTNTTPAAATASAFPSSAEEGSFRANFKVAHYLQSALLDIILSDSYATAPGGIPHNVSFTLACADGVLCTAG